MKFLHRNCAPALVGLLLLSASAASWAVLGGDTRSVTQDQARWGSTMVVSPSDRFSVYSLTGADGVRVREYVSASGQVFAVAWDVPVLPALEALLGNYFPAYQDGLRQKSRGVHVQQPGIVIESGGRMRAFVGRAYLPGQLPAMVDAKDIQ